MSRSLFHTFGVRKILYPINQDIKTYGFSPVIRSIIQKCAPGFRIDMSKKTKKTLAKGRILLISNHPSQADVLLLLASAPSSQPFFLVAINSIKSILPAMNKNLIPVYISHRLNSRKKYDWKYHLLKKIHFTPEYSQKVAHQKNIQSIKKATTKIDQGSIVGIFPAGGAENGHDFSPGVGHIIKNLKYPQKTSIIMAYISGTSTWDFFRIIPFIRKFFPKFRIRFSPPVKASNFSSENGRQIAQQLQAYYYNWSFPFHPLPKLWAYASYLRSILLFLFLKNH